MIFSENIFRFSFFILLVLCISCGDDDVPAPTQTLTPVFDELPVFSPISKTVGLSAQILNFDDLANGIQKYGFAVAKNEFEGIDADYVSEYTILPNAFLSDELELDPNEVYYYKAYVQFNDELFISETSQIYTKKGKWSTSSLFPGGQLLDATSFVIDGKAYITGGASEKLWMYDPETDTWTQKASMAVTCQNPVSFVIDGIGYVGLNLLGAHTQEDDNFWAYDPSTDTWSAISRCENYIDGIVVDVSAAFAFDDYGYIQSRWTSLTRYDPTTDTWSIVDTENAFKNDGDDYQVISNGVDTVIVVNNEQVQLFTTTDNDWHWKEDHNIPISAQINGDDRNNGVGFYLNGRFYMGMGVNEEGISRENLYTYQTNYDAWDNYINLIERENDYGYRGMHRGVSFVIGNKAYMGLGKTTRMWGNTLQEEDNLKLWIFEEM